MVLKEKEDLCNWFKLLHPRKRIDYMCGLLHLCLPLELRFIGTVLEDVAKKDFNYLRDAENKANNPSELTNDGYQSFADRHFRSKILVNLALMHSTDGSCADIIFGILEKQFDSLMNYFQDPLVLDDILTIFTLACHHPAFNIHQRLRLGEVLKSTENHCNYLWENPAFLKNFQANPSIPTAFPCRLSKGITSIAVQGTRDEHQNKKSGNDYVINTTWSNGDITQHFMKHKELQNLHHQIFNKFSDEKRLQSLFPGQRRHRQENKEEKNRHDSREEKLLSMKSYFSELSKAQHILACDILTRAFQNGKPISAPPQVYPSLSQPTFYPPYMPDNRYGHYPDGVRIPYFPQANAVNMMSMAATGLSSSTTSPSNSRSSSPSVTIINNKNIRSDPATLSSIADKDISGHNKLKTGLPQQQVVVDATTMETLPPPQVETVQLLRLLDLEQYSKILASYTLHEVYSMTAEEMAKLGLPLDAQMKLQSKLDHQKHSLQGVNGLIQVQGCPPISNNKQHQQERVVHSFPTAAAWQRQGHLSPVDSSATAVVNQQQQPPSMPYPPAPIPIPIPQYHLVSTPVSLPQNAIAQSSFPSSVAVAVDGSRNSNANSPSTVASVDQYNPSLSPGVNSIPDSPPSSLASPTSVYFEEKNVKNHQGDDSESEEDKILNQSIEENESTTHGSRGPGRPLQSISLPLLNNNTSSPGTTEKGKVNSVPASLSAPLVTNEAASVVRESGTPPMVPVNVSMVNGFVSENSSYLPPNLVMSFSGLQHHHQQQQQQQQHHNPHHQPPHHHHQHRFKSAQPTHTGHRMYKNVINMPCLDMTTQPPPPAPSINKNNGGVAGANGGGGGINPIMQAAAMLHHHHHPYIIQQANMQQQHAANSSMIHAPPQQQQPNNNIPPLHNNNNMPTGQPMLPPSLANAVENNGGGNITTLPFMSAMVPAPGSGPGPNFIPPHSRGVITTMSSSVGMMSAAPTVQQQQQQPTAAAASHSPSPTPAVQLDQAQQIPYIHPNADGLDTTATARHEEGIHNNNNIANKPNNNNINNPPQPAQPPNHTNNNSTTNNSNGGGNSSAPLSHISNIATRPGSGTATPSPPLPLPPPKQIVVSGDSSSSVVINNNNPQQQHHQTMFVPPPYYMIPNLGNVSVTMPPYSANPHQQQNSLQQHFPNSIAPEMYHLQAARFQLPMGSGQLPPNYYGSQAFNHPTPHIHHNNNNGNNGNLSHHHHHHTAGNNNSNGGNGNKNTGKNSCYNCGSSGHKANDCKESPMDSMTNSFRLNIKPKSDSE